MSSLFMATGLPFFIIVLLGPLFIRILKKLNFGQQIRSQGPESHSEKEGIPTMGGVAIILALLLSSWFVLEPESDVIWALLITCGMGCIGFLDDYLQIRAQRSLGLKARYKISGQFLLGLLLALYTYRYSSVGADILLPGGNIISLGAGIIPFIMLTVVGTANAVNLTDGLDGLASGITVTVAGLLGIFLWQLNNLQLSLFSLIVAGACIGFLWYNSHPARVFMGDTGSLALGGAISAVAVLAGAEILLLIAGLVFVGETLSVMIQVTYFRITGGRRIFAMTPLHHHFELKGKKESKIVAWFIIMSLVFCGLGLFLFQPFF